MYDRYRLSASVQGPDICAVEVPPNSFNYGIWRL